MARLAAGESVLIGGAGGGVGLYAVQLAEVLGAGSVIGAAGTPARREAALAAGADHVVDYGERGWVDEVRDLTEERGTDVVLESAGGEVFNQSVHGFNIGAFFMLRPQEATEALTTLIGLVATGRVKTQVTATLALAQAAEAHRRLEDRETTGKIVLRPWE